MPLELLWLAILSAFWPLLLVVDVLAFQTPRPVRTLVGFFAGGLLTTVVIGVLIVLRLADSSLINRSRPTLDPAADICFGLLGLAAAFVVARRGPKPGPAAPAKPSRTERAIKGGPAVAFAAGVLLNVVPGVFPFIALKDIAELNYSTAATVAVVTGFYLVMFVLVEAPIVGYSLAPRQTERRVTAFNAWLHAHMQSLAVWGLAAGGVYLLARGIIQLL